MAGDKGREDEFWYKAAQVWTGGSHSRGDSSTFSAPPLIGKQSVGIISGGEPIQEPSAMLGPPTPRSIPRAESSSQQKLTELALFPPHSPSFGKAPPNSSTSDLFRRFPAPGNELRGVTTPPRPLHRARTSPEKSLSELTLGPSHDTLPGKLGTRNTFPQFQPGGKNLHPLDKVFPSLPRPGSLLRQKSLGLQDDTLSAVAFSELPSILSLGSLRSSDPLGGDALTVEAGPTDSSGGSGHVSEYEGPEKRRQGLGESASQASTWQQKGNQALIRAKGVEKKIVQGASSCETVVLRGQRSEGEEHNGRREEVKGRGEKVQSASGPHCKAERIAEPTVVFRSQGESAVGGRVTMGQPESISPLERRESLAESLHPRGWHRKESGNAESAGSHQTERNSGPLSVTAVFRQQLVDQQKNEGLRQTGSPELQALNLFPTPAGNSIDLFRSSTQTGGRGAFQGTPPQTSPPLQASLFARQAPPSNPAFYPPWTTELPRLQTWKDSDQSENATWHPTRELSQAGEAMLPGESKARSQSEGATWQGMSAQVKREEAMAPHHQLVYPLLVQSRSAESLPFHRGEGLLQEQREGDTWQVISAPVEEGAGKRPKRHCEGEFLGDEPPKRRHVSSRGEPERVGVKAAQPEVYTCRFCGITFDKPTALGGHMRSHRRERNREKASRGASGQAPRLLPTDGLSEVPLLPGPWGAFTFPPPPPFTYHGR